jgi:hypothetical protein
MKCPSPTLSRNAVTLEIASDPYEDAALIYIRLVRKESQEAADTLDQIYADFGSHAALRAALILTIVQIEVQENHWLPNIGLYVNLLADYPDALPLTKHAMRCYLRSWDAPIAELGEWVALAFV